MKLALVCLVIVVSGCGAVTPQSMYEGLRTQQSLKNAGSMPPAEKLDPYDAYEKQRDSLKPAQ